MEKRQIKMHDGRYLIFYTFGDEHAPSDARANQEEASDSEPEAKPEAVEERRV